MPTTPTDILARLRAANPVPVSPERANEPIAQATLERILNDPGPGEGPPPPPRPRRRLGRLMHAAPVLAAMVVALAVVGTALVLVGRGHGPAPASRSSDSGIRALIAHTPQHRLFRELGYVYAAIYSVGNSKPCRVQQPSGVTYTQGSPGNDLLSILGVLRRPATSADRVNPQALGSMPDVYRAYIRRAFSADGVSYYIVPSRFDRAATNVPSRRCMDLMATAFNRYLPRIPASMRQPSRELEAALFAYFGSFQWPRDVVCLVAVSGNGIGPSCGTGTGAKAIETGFATENSPGIRVDTFSGVVPDGVATVTLVFPAPAHTVSTRVEGNVYVVRAQFYAVHGSPPSPTVVWRSADGRVLRRRDTSDAANLASICKQPIACLLAEAVGTAHSSTSSSSRSARSAAVAKPGG